MTLTDDTLIEAAATGAAAATRARDLRERLRWNVDPTDDERRADIEAMLEELRLAMVPLRSAIGGFARGPQRPDVVEDAVREASAAVQYQRRQMKKMRR